MKNLICCPYCLKVGKKNILGEITDYGFIIKRFHKGETIVTGGDFGITCGLCGELIMFRRTNKPKRLTVSKSYKISATI